MLTEEFFLGLPLKDIQTERHLYNCMALTANSYNFTWSRWNLLSGYDKLIMQFREKLPGSGDISHQVMLITPENTSVLECSSLGMFMFLIDCGVPSRLHNNMMDQFDGLKLSKSRS